MSLASRHPNLSATILLDETDKKIGRILVEWFAKDPTINLSIFEAPKDLDEAQVILILTPEAGMDWNALPFSLLEPRGVSGPPIVPLVLSNRKLLATQDYGQPPLHIAIDQQRESTTKLRKRLASCMNSEQSTIRMEVDTSPPYVSECLLGRYRKLTLLGTGGMGTVHLCWDEEAELKVAVKRLHPHLGSVPGIRDRVRTNFKLVQGLNHPAIANHKHIEVSGTETLLILEYVPGLSLLEWMERHREKRSLAFLSTLLRPVAEALDYAHAKKVIHRDIKPSNIQVTREDFAKFVSTATVGKNELSPSLGDEKGIESKLLDFGIATPLVTTVMQSPDGKGETPISGTIPYMAPEQAAGQHQNAATDQYAFAASLYHCLAGRLPISIDPSTPFTTALVKRIQTESVPEITGLGKTANQAFQRALSKDPKRRFQSCSDFLMALEADTGKSKSQQLGIAGRLSVPLTLIMVAGLVLLGMLKTNRPGEGKGQTEAALQGGTIEHVFSALLAGDKEEAREAMDGLRDLPPELRIELSSSERDKTDLLLEQLTILRKDQPKNHQETEYARPRILCMYGLNTVPPKHAAWLGKFRNSLTKDKRIQLVSRSQLDNLLRELQIGADHSLSNEDALLLVGQILPASLLLDAKWLSPDVLDLQVISTERTITVYSEPVTSFDPSQAVDQVERMIKELCEEKPLKSGILHREGEKLLLGMGTFHGLQNDCRIGLLQPAPKDKPFALDEHIGEFSLERVLDYTSVIQVEPTTNLPENLSGLRAIEILPE